MRKTFSVSSVRVSFLPLFLVLLTFGWLAFTSRVAAQSPSTNILPALTPLDRASPVELIAVTLDADLAEDAGDIRVTGSATYKLHNTDTLNDVEIPLGFPAWSGGDLTSDPNLFDQFKVYVDDQPIRLTRASAPLRLGNQIRTVDWYSWTLKIASDDKHLVRVDFAQNLGNEEFPRFQFGIVTSTGWKGRIGSERLAVRMPAPTTLEQFLAFDPFIPEFDGQTLTWRATDFEPSTNLGVTLVRPSDWNALVVKRQTVAQNANDVNAHLALGTTYMEFAALPSLRRDSFLALALAEFETAARLDPKNVTALSQLAQIYEARAGATTGARNTNYVALAAQEWQGLLGTGFDADAKKHLAEDNFYLGVDARARQDYASAVKFFDAARGFAPNGAPPTFTTDQVNAQKQAALIAWARLFAEQGDFTNALAKAREANGGNYSLTAAPTLPTFAVTRAQMTTNAVERLITLNLIGLPDAERSSETNDAFDALVANLTRMNVATVSAETNGDERTLTIRLPYSSDADLQARERALADVFGGDEAWSVVRALLLPTSLEIAHTQDALNDHVQYREVFDFTASAQARQARLDALAKALSALDGAKADDDAAQLQRALLSQVNTWLKNAYAGGAANMEFVTPDGARQEWTLTFGDSRESPAQQGDKLTLNRTSLRPELWFIVGGIALAVIVTGGGLWWVLRKRKANAEGFEESE